MPTAKKIETVDEITERLSRSSIIIGTDYRGMKAGEMTELRRRLREVKAEVRVVKNTLLHLAAERAGKAEAARVAEGPTAIIIGYGDVAEPAKVLTEHIRASRIPLALRSAYLEGQILNASQVQELANLPPREMLLGQAVGALWSPLVTFMGLLNATLRQFAGLVEARANQLEGGGPEETAVSV